MAKFLKIFIPLVLVFFVWEGYRVFTYRTDPLFPTKEVDVPNHSPIVSKSKKTPKLTIVFVADAAGKGSIDKVAPFLKGGIHFLQKHGTHYLNVFHPHANCSTAQGHASLTTGTFPCYHGMVNNQWLDSEEHTFSVVQDNELALSGVFNPTNDSVYNVNETSETVKYYYTSGVSPRNYRVDNLSDQLMLFSTPLQNTKVFSISSHQEPAVLMAGRLGKAFWLDGPTGLFTTSRYYYPKGIPSWVKEFNSDHVVPATFVWEPIYPQDSEAYQFSGAKNYRFSDIFHGVMPTRQTLLGALLHSQVPVFGSGPYITSPLGIKTLYEFANEIIDSQMEEGENDRMVLWVNHVAFDTLAGFIGPQTQDAIDTLYQLDQGIGSVIRHAMDKVPPEDCLFVFCSDESYIPAIPEVLREKGFDLAMRTITDRVPKIGLVDRMNDELGCQYIRTIIPPFVYMHYPIFQALSKTDQDNVLQKVKSMLRLVPGIKDAWLFDELISFPFEREDQGRFFKLHLFRNNPPEDRRSGEVIFQSLPFNYVTSNLTSDPEPMFGVDHTSCYDYDSHTALYIYQPGRFEGKSLNQPVMIQQVAVSLAEILNVPRPSAASIDIKPLPLED